MAGYRPKSLDELNNMYDKTIEAEKAIIKGTSLLRKNEEYSDFSSDSGDIDKITEEVREAVGVSDAVSDFIAKYSTLETLPGMQIEDTARPKPEDVVFSQEPERQEKSFEISPEEAEPVQKEKEPVNRDELMNEYMRIMNDEEDDDDEEFSSKKLSRKEKKKLRKQEKLDAMNKKEESAEEAEAAQNVQEEAVGDEAEEEPVIAEEESDVIEEPSLLERYEEEYGDIQSQQEAYSEEEKNDFDFPEDYTPQWMEPEETKAEENEPQAEEKNTLFVAVKIALSVALAVLVLIGGVSTALKTVLAVNTGKTFNDNYYAFTAERDYADTGILKGDLVITEKRYAEKDEIFAYVDFNEKSFEFGKHTDSITSIDGTVLIVAEKDGGRALISRDDCKGVVHKVYPSFGNFVRFVTDNYVVIIAVISVLSLVIVLTLALAFKGKGKNNRDTEEAVSESNEAEEEDLFSNIE